MDGRLMANKNDLAKGKLKKSTNLLWLFSEDSPFIH